MLIFGPRIFNYIRDSLLVIGLDLPLILACFFPVIAWFAYFFLSRLESYKMDPKQAKKVLAFINMRFNKTVVSQDSIPLNSRNKFTQWFVNTNYSQYRSIIAQGTNMSNVKLIEIACQSTASIHRGTYILWGILAIVVFALTYFLPQDFKRFLLLLSIMFPGMLLGAGTISFFQLVNNKKRLLAQLAIMPCFYNKQNFANAFLTYVIMNQVKLYAFIIFITGLFLTLPGHITWNSYLNIILLSIFMCFFSLSLMFWSWSAKQAQEGGIIWSMIIAFITVLVVILVSFEETIILLQSSVFNGLFLACILIFWLNIYKCYKQLPYYS